MGTMSMSIATMLTGNARVGAGTIVPAYGDLVSDQCLTLQGGSDEEEGGSSYDTMMDTDRATVMGRTDSGCRSDSFEEKFKKRAKNQYSEYENTGRSSLSFQDNSRLASYNLTQDAAKEHVLNYPTAEDYAAYTFNHVKNRFISKVYAILSLQLMFTFVWTAFTLYGPQGFGDWCVVNWSWTQWVILCVQIVNIIALFHHKHSYPLNVALLCSFTFIISFLMGTVAAMYRETGQASVVLTAWGTATVLFLGLSAYTHINPCKTDFASFGTGLFVMLWVLLIWGVFINIFGSSYFMYKVYCLIGILVFMAYICYDTNQLVSKFGPGDEFVASVELYLDFINLVLYILQCLGSRN